MAKTNTIITIGREYGSAGRQIGYKVAEDLGIKLYDREMLERAAKESGICEELFETHDEKPTNSFLYSLVMDTYSMGFASGSVNDDFSHYHRSRCRNAPYHDFRHGRKGCWKNTSGHCTSGRSWLHVWRNPGSKRWCTENCGNTDWQIWSEKSRMGTGTYRTGNRNYSIL